MSNYRKLKYGLETPSGKIVERFRTIGATQTTKYYFEEQYGCELKIIQLQCKGI